MMAHVSESKGRLVRGFAEDGGELVFDAKLDSVVITIWRDDMATEMFHVSGDQWESLCSDIAVMRHIARRALLPGPDAQTGADIPLVGTQVDEVTDVDAQEPDDLIPGPLDNGA